MDCFEELGLERRLTWGEEELRERYDERCRAAHPDAGGDPEDFRSLGQAYAELRSPGRRLRHWLELGGCGVEKSGGMGAAVMELFGELGLVMGKADEVGGRKREAKSALARSLAEREGLAVMEELERARERTAALVHDLTSRFAGFEKRGPEACCGEAAEAARGLLFLEKWERELRERWASLVG